MTRVLVIYYSQTWETAEIAKLFSSELAAAGAEVLLEPILPRIRYLYPWKSIRRFFNQMPKALGPLLHSGILLASISAIGLNLLFNGWGSIETAEAELTESALGAEA